MGVCFDGDECGGKGVGNVAVYVQGRSQTFQNKGAARGSRGTYRDSKWQPSVDPSTKCHFI